MKIKKIATGIWKENCYIISKDNDETLIIDPGNDKNILSKYIDDNSLNVIAILNTHAHYDHIGAVKYLKEKYKIPFFLHSFDKKILSTANLYIKIFESTNFIEIPSVDYFYDYKEIKEIINEFKIEIVYTPGHTQGSVCLLIEDCLFTGDTLFNGKIGRTDLPGGNEKSLKESLKKISKMPPNLNIYPGHGSESTIEYELKYNKKFINSIL